MRRIKLFSTIVVGCLTLCLGCFGCQHEHNYLEKKIKPTCVADGYSIFTCSCGESYIDNFIDKVAHSYTEKIIEPTCIEQGYSLFSCECGDNYKDNYVDKIEHVYINYVSDNNASFIKDGTKTAKCENAYCESTDTVIDNGSLRILYELPIVEINTAGQEINSKVDYTEMTFNLKNCESIIESAEGGIRLRGNSTANYDKKPYRIKFDKKQALFGLTKAKSWVLLADYLDPSTLHNYVAFKIASEMSGFHFTPTPYKVNVYLNGEYKGIYTLCEQVQENDGRMDIENEITDAMTDLKDFNFYICMDYNAPNDEGAMLNETYFYLENYDRYIELKYPEKEQFTSEQQFISFFEQLKDYVGNLFDAFYEQDVEKIKEEVNINSLTDYLIVDQIMGEQDHASKSFNMYYTNTSDDLNENKKLNFGPIWDYDWALYTPWTGLPNQNFELSSEIKYSNLFFTAIANNEELFAVVKNRYYQYARSAVNKILEDFDDLVLSMENSLSANNELWYSTINESLTEQNIKFLKEFLTNRLIVLDNAWRN